MVTSLESSEKDRICIASRLWQLYCYTPAEQTERLRLSSFVLAYEAEEAEEEAECPDSPEEEEEAGASSSEG